MQYLTGAPHHAAAEHGIGLLLTPGDKNDRQISQYPCWAADNGCYRTGDRFRLAPFLAWLCCQQPYQASCRFAVAPDVVADAAATLARSLPVLPQIRALGYPAAYVAQDGQEALPVPWDAFDVLFIGGSTTWKTSEAAATLASTAHRQGKTVHMGRVNSLVRLQAAQSMGCDSADGTMLAYKPDARLQQLLRWLTRLECQPSLWSWGGGERADAAALGTAEREFVRVRFPPAPPECSPALQRA